MRNQLEKEKNPAIVMKEQITKKKVTTAIQSEKKMSVEKQDYAPSGSRSSTFFLFLQTCEYCLGTQRK